MRLPSCYMLGQTRILGLKELRWAWFSSFGGHHHYPGSSYYRVAQLSSSQSSATGGPHAAGKLQRCTPRAHCSHSPSCPQDPKTWELNNQSNDQGLPFQKWCSLAQKGQQGSPAVSTLRPSARVVLSPPPPLSAQAPAMTPATSWVFPSPQRPYVGTLLESDILGVSGKNYIFILLCLL